MEEEDNFDLGCKLAIKHFNANPIPNRRDAECCGNCKHWTWGYEGEGDCEKFSLAKVEPNGEPMELNRCVLGADAANGGPLNSTERCDLWFPTTGED